MRRLGNLRPFARTRQFVTTTNCHYDNLSRQYFDYTTICHAAKLSHGQFVTRIQQGNHFFRRQFVKRTVCNTWWQIVTATICHNKKFSSAPIFWVAKFSSAQIFDLAYSLFWFDFGIYCLAIKIWKIEIWITLSNSEDLTSRLREPRVFVLTRQMANSAFGPIIRMIRRRLARKCI